jgi:hypothetical protein
MVTRHLHGGDVTRAESAPPVAPLSPRLRQLALVPSLVIGYIIAQCTDMISRTLGPKYIIQHQQPCLNHIDKGSIGFSSGKLRGKMSEWTLLCSF